MLIALHQSHHHLPFWHNPQQPKEVFDPKLHAERVMQFRDETEPAKETWLWSFLQGLHDVDVPVMAHVSAFCGCKGDGTFHWPKRIWVQITHLPQEKDELGIPVVVKDGKTVAESLWGGDNGTYTPYGLLQEKGEAEWEPSKHTPEFWKNFFLTKLRQVKEGAKEDMLETRQAASAARAHAKRLEALIP